MRSNSDNVSHDAWSRMERRQNEQLRALEARVDDLLERLKQLETRASQDEQHQLEQHERDD